MSSRPASSRSGITGTAASSSPSSMYRPRPPPPPAPPSADSTPETELSVAAPRRRGGAGPPSASADDPVPSPQPPVFADGGAGPDPGALSPSSAPREGFIHRARHVRRGCTGSSRPRGRGAPVAPRRKDNRRTRLDAPRPRTRPASAASTTPRTPSSTQRTCVGQWLPPAPEAGGLVHHGVGVHGRVGRSGDDSTTESCARGRRRTNKQSLKWPTHTSLHTQPTVSTTFLAPRTPSSLVVAHRAAPRRTRLHHEAKALQGRQPSGRRRRRTRRQEQARGRGRRRDRGARSRRGGGRGRRG